MEMSNCFHLGHGSIALAGVCAPALHMRCSSHNPKCTNLTNKQRCDGAHHNM